MKNFLKIVFLIFILYIPIISFSENINIPKEDSMVEKAEFKGPYGKPYVKGPTSPPPTNEEILAMRGIEKNKENIFQKIWNWFISLFN